MMFFSFQPMDPSKIEPRFQGIPLICIVKQAQNEKDLFYASSSLALASDLYIKANQPDKALAVANQIHLKNLQAFEILKIFKSQLLNKKLPEAESLLLRVLLLAKESDDSIKDTILSAVAITYIELEMYDKALEILDTISDFENKANVFDLLASHYIKKSQFSKLIPVVNQLLELVETAGTYRRKNYYLSNIAGYYAQAGQYDKAMETFNKIDNQAANERARFLDVLVGIFINSGMYEKATQIANTYTEPSQRSKLITEIAQTLFRTGNHERAFKLMEASFLDPTDKNQFLSTMVEDFVDRNQFDAALEKVELIEDLSARADSLTIFIEAYKEDKNYEKIEAFLEKLFQLIQNLNHNKDKIDFLVYVADKYHEIGKQDQAIEMLEEAYLIADSIEDISEKSTAFYSITDGYIQIHEYKVALQLSMTLLKYDKSNTLVKQIIRKFAEAENYQVGLKLIQHIGDTAERQRLNYLFECSISFSKSSNSLY